MLKKIILLIIIALNTNIFFAQFKINIEVNDSFENKSVIIYTLNGSKNMLLGNAKKKGKQWIINIPNDYRGVMRAYFPTANKNIDFISENEDINIKLTTENNNIVDIEFLDKANQIWKQTIIDQHNENNVLPLLKNLKQFYPSDSNFGMAISKEIYAIQNNKNNIPNNFYFTNYYIENNKYASNTSEYNSKDYINFLVNSGEMLETSSILRPAILNYLRSIENNDIENSIEYLLEQADVKTNRGQNILSELLSIFDTYGLNQLHEKYYKLASNLTCEINNNLKDNIDAVKRNYIGATFSNYTFTSKKKNTKAKSTKDIKADKKLIFFWASSCPHCVSELPIILENYNKLKSKNIEVIAISLDSDPKSYSEKTESLPWINDTELRGWNSSFIEKYNITATPTYFLLDKNNIIIDKPNNFSTFLSSNNLN